MTTIPRRRLIGAGAAAGVGVALAGCTRAEAEPSATTTAQAARDAVLAGALRASRPFRGEHQPGTVDEPQQHAVLVTFDLVKGSDVGALRRLMTLWTDDIDHLMGGRASVADFEPEMTSEPASLTVTVGLGPGALALRGVRGGRPEWLGPLPALPIDRLDPAYCGGDLLLQICAESAVSVSHARWVLTKEARGIATVRWVQQGFRPPVGGPGGTMRNHFGQVDGIVQPPADLVWIDDGPAWLRGGTSMVVRRIAMNLDTWEEADPQTREYALGRRQSNGSPLTGHAMTDAPNLAAVDRDGLPVIDTFSHVRRAMPASERERFLRRPYSYDDPPTGAALTNAGLLFVAFQASLREQYWPVQKRLAESDLMNTWTTPVGSAVFAIPRGARPGEVLAQDLWA